MVSVYMAMYSKEIVWFASLAIGIGIGVLVAYQHGVEKGYGNGFDMGYALGKREKAKRDDKGRFTR